MNMEISIVSQNRFTEGFGEGKNPVEKDRYILFWAKGCNWSNRAAIARELLGLEDAVKVEIVDWTDREENLGWEFVNSRIISIRKRAHSS